MISYKPRFLILKGVYNIYFDGCVRFIQNNIASIERFIQIDSFSKELKYFFNSFVYENNSSFQHLVKVKYFNRLTH